MELDVRVTELSYIAATPLAAPPNPALCTDVVCEDALKFDLEVELATGDGAIRGTTDLLVFAEADSQVLTTRSGFQEGPLFGVSSLPPRPPLSAFEGGLDLGLDAQRPHSGELAVRMMFAELGSHGSVVPRVWYLERTPGDALPYALPSPLSPIVGSWPVPSCRGSAAPVPSDAILPTGATLGELFADFAAQMASSFPVTASWLNGSQTELLVELEGEFDLACELATSVAPAYVLSARLHLTTADGRLDTRQPGRLRLSLDETGPTWRFDIDGEAMDVASFSALTGFAEAAFEGDSEAMFALNGRLDRGDLQAWGFSDQRHTREYLFWCLGDDCSAYPRPNFVEATSSP